MGGLAWLSVPEGIKMSTRYGSDTAEHGKEAPGAGSGSMEEWALWRLAARRSGPRPMDRL